jgi:hypothetical protein
MTRDVAAVLAAASGGLPIIPCMRGLRSIQTLFELTVATLPAMDTDVWEYGYADFADGDFHAAVTDDLSA